MIGIHSATRQSYEVLVSRVYPPFVSYSMGSSLFVHVSYLVGILEGGHQGNPESASTSLEVLGNIEPFSSSS